MANIFVVYTIDRNTNEVVESKNIDASNYPEQVIASALYWSDKYAIMDKRTSYLIGVTKYYAEGYNHYSVENGKFYTDVIDYEEVKHFDHELIERLFYAYKYSKELPFCHPVECYCFLGEARPQDTRPVQMDSFTKETDWYSYMFWNKFVDDVIHDPKKYGQRATDICTHVYFRPYFEKRRIDFAQDMIDFPDWLKPRGVKIENVAGGMYKVTAFLDGLVRYANIVKVTGTCDMIPSHNVEIVGRFVQKYVDSILEPAYALWTKDNKDYKVFAVSIGISASLEALDMTMKAKEGFSKYVLSKKELLQFIQKKDDRFTDGDITLTINALKTPEVVERMKASHAYSSFLKPAVEWIEGKKKSHEILFIG